MLLWAGCAGVTPPSEPPPLSPLVPVWSDVELQRHLRVFNGEGAAGRATGTRGYVQVAQYVAARWRDFGLQPGFGSSFQGLYPTLLNYPVRLRMTRAGPDTLYFVPGLDVLPHARTDSGRVAVRDVVPVAGAGPERGAVVVHPSAQLDATLLDDLRRRGVRAVLALGPLRPALATSPVPGLMVVQMTERAAARMLDVPPGELSARLAGGGPIRLPGELAITVGVEPNRYVHALNLLGYVPGSHPLRAKELVIVCADLDGFGRLAGTLVFDPRHTGEAAAAVLELARHYAAVARLLDVPERTLLLALWSGARLEHAGLRAYLDAPVWPLDRTHAVIYLGLDPSETDTVERLLGPSGVPLYPVLLPDSLRPEEPPVLVPDPAWQPVVSARRPDDWPPPVPWSSYLDRAVARARYLAEAGHRLILRESIGLEPPVMPPAPRREPVPKDTTIRR
ncbi:MAG: hypothetical protein KatS3mg044_1099 [Rhodothermaceae bacterium]|nr:MAG: hypothetical protein KatS3mg044_1099 [Rhodothermaceae bacterium]